MWQWGIYDSMDNAFFGFFGRFGFLFWVLLVLLGIGAEELDGGGDCRRLFLGDYGHLFVGLYGMEGLRCFAI
ncbi:MAG: hypothetical protein KDK65_04200 [Chlamydiia bacterium]|nr:hypothetical protein [Chlamydiia bacterium]